MFAVQSEISQTVAEALKVKLLPKEKEIIERQQVVRPDAFDKYLLAKQRRQLGDVLVSIGFLEEVIRLDPGFAVAYADLADNYVTAAGDHLPVAEAFTKATEYANKAIELDDRQAEAWLAKGNLIMQYKWDWNASERALKRAIELQPNFANAYRVHTYLPTIDPQQAVELAKKSVDLDPVSVFARGRLCLLLARAKMREAALYQCDRLALMDPENINTPNYLGLAYAELGLMQDARKSIDQLRTKVKARLAIGARSTGLYAPWAYFANAFIYSTQGDLQPVKEMLKEADELAKVGYVDPVGRAVLYLAIGERERGLDIMEKEIEERDPTILFLWDLFLLQTVLL